MVESLHSIITIFSFKDSILESSKTIPLDTNDIILKMTYFI